MTTTTTLSSANALRHLQQEVDAFIDDLREIAIVAGDGHAGPVQRLAIARLQAIVDQAPHRVGTEPLLARLGDDIRELTTEMVHDEGFDSTCLADSLAMTLALAADDLV